MDWQRNFSIPLSFLIELVIANNVVLFCLILFLGQFLSRAVEAGRRIVPKLGKLFELIKLVFRTLPTKLCVRIHAYYIRCDSMQWRTYSYVPTSSTCFYFLWLRVLLLLKDSEKNTLRETKILLKKVNFYVLLKCAWLAQRIELVLRNAQKRERKTYSE